MGCPVAVSRPAWEAFNGGARLRVPPRDAIWPFLKGWAMQGLPLFTPADWRLLRRTGIHPRGETLGVPILPLDEGAEAPGLAGWRVLLTPGHADDAMCLHHADAGFLVTGDTVRNYLGGEWNPIRTDRDAYLRTQAALRALPVRTVFPGHGPVFERQGIIESLRDVPD